MKNKRMILLSEAVFTGLGEKPSKGAIVVEGNKIIKVLNDWNYAEFETEDTKVIDCGKKMIMPGFIDAHTHFFMGATCASEHICTKLEASTSSEECLQMAADYAKEHPEEPRVLGFGWYLPNWNSDILPTKKELDEVFPDKPAYLFNADAHTVLVNSKALKECNITKDKKVEYGEVCLGEDGEPNGILKEVDAQGSAFNKLWDFPSDWLEDMFADFIRGASEQGITYLSDMTSPLDVSAETENLFNALVKMDSDDNLDVRVNLYTSLFSETEFEGEAGYAKHYSGDKVNYSGVKFYIDGVTTTYTGLLLEPYTDMPDTLGEPFFSKEKYRKFIIKANEMGLGVRLHCIGDGAVRWALDIFEESNKVNDNLGNKKGLLNAVEHIESIHPDDIGRFKELGVIASMQPAHLVLDANEKVDRIGVERCRYEWPFKSLIDTGAIMAFGTDYPVVGLNPFEGIHAAVTRCDKNDKPTGVNPEEKISLYEALKAYTLGGAIVYGRESDIGTLEEGKLADIVVVNENMFEVDEAEIKNCQADLTIMDGNVVFDRYNIANSRG